MSLNKNVGQITCSIPIINNYEFNNCFSNQDYKKAIHKSVYI